MSAENKRPVNRYDLITPMLPCKDEIMVAFERILLSGNYILGEEVKLLEKELAEACQVPAAVGVASGSSALYLALAVTGIGPGTEVITTPYTFVATIEAIIRLGATPVLVDIRPGDLNIDPDLVTAAINKRTRAILPVHIFGAPCDMNPLCTIADAHGLDIIEDMAQAFGTFYDGRPCGSFGRMASLSFYPTKNLPGMGDGGMIFCKSPADAEQIRKLRGHDPVNLNGRLCSGWNSRLDEVQSMIIRIRHARFKEEQADRDRVAAIYEKHIPTAHRLLPPNRGSRVKVTYHQYWVRSDSRDELARILNSHSIETGIYYDPPLHHHPLAEYCRVSGPLTEAERAGSQILALPIHPALPLEDAERIGKIVGDFLRASGGKATGS